MPFREDFFEDPLLRLTPPCDLNDPFDSKVSHEAINRKAAVMTNDFGTYAAMRSDFDLSNHSNIVDYLKNELDNYGVISLTEDRYNLLMWSHYANEHKGIVVEYGELETMMVVSKNCVTSYNPSVSVPLPVKYTRRRPNKNIDDEYIYDTEDKSFFQHIAFVKGDDWIYEKEHRILLPFLESDVSILISNLPNVDVERELNALELEFSYVGNGLYKFERGEKSIYYNPMIFALKNPAVKKLGKVMAFKRPKVNSIKSITFGLKVENSKIRKAISIYKQSKFYHSNVRYFKAVQSEAYFELDFVEIFE
ncbi:TPA: DUF2971 domain-containing protein [Vibrio vulnificus]|nr:DUF2971 domain-containing protein [Vibrio vulnificus]